MRPTTTKRTEQPLSPSGGLNHQVSRSHGHSPTLPEANDVLIVRHSHTMPSSAVAFPLAIDAVEYVAEAEHSWLRQVPPSEQRVDSHGGVRGAARDEPRCAAGLRPSGRALDRAPVCPGHIQWRRTARVNGPVAAKSAGRRVSMLCILTFTTWPTSLSAAGAVGGQRVEAKPDISDHRSRLVLRRKRACLRAASARASSRSAARPTTSVAR